MVYLLPIALGGFISGFILPVYGLAEAMDFWMYATLEISSVWAMNLAGGLFVVTSFA